MARTTHSTGTSMRIIKIKMTSGTSANIRLILEEEKAAETTQCHFESVCVRQGGEGEYI